LKLEPLTQPPTFAPCCGRTWSPFRLNLNLANSGRSLVPLDITDAANTLVSISSIGPEGDLKTWSESLTAF
jgi:hypothetical protein